MALPTFVAIKKNAALVIGYFKERSSLQVPALLLLAVLLKVGYLSAPLPSPAFVADGGLLSHWLNTHAAQIHHGVLRVLGMLALLASVIYAGFVTGNRRMFTQRHVLVATAMLLFSSLFPVANLALPALLVLPMLIGVFASLTRLYQSEHTRTNIMNAGLLAGMAYLLYHPFVWWLPGCFIVLAFMRPFRLAEWVLLLLAIFTPAYFVLAIEFLTDNWHPQQHLPSLGKALLPVNISWYWWLAVGMAIVWFLISFAAWQQQTRRMVIQGRKNWYSLLLMGLVAMPGLFFSQQNMPGMLVLLTFPAGCLLANAFAGENKGKGQLLFFWLLIIVVAIVGWGWKNGMM